MVLPIPFALGAACCAAAHRLLRRKRAHSSIHEVAPGAGVADTGALKTAPDQELGLEPSPTDVTNIKDHEEASIGASPASKVGDVPSTPKTVIAAPPIAAPAVTPAPAAAAGAATTAGAATATAADAEAINKTPGGADTAAPLPSCDTGGGDDCEGLDIGSEGGAVEEPAPVVAGSITGGAGGGNPAEHPPSSAGLMHTEAAGPGAATARAAAAAPCAGASIGGSRSGGGAGCTISGCSLCSGGSNQAGSSSRRRARRSEVERLRPFCWDKQLDKYPLKAGTFLGELDNTIARGGVQVQDSSESRERRAKRHCSETPHNDEVVIIYSDDDSMAS